MSASSLSVLEPAPFHLHQPLALSEPSCSEVPSKKARKAKATTLRPSDWEPYKDLVIDLHTRQNLPLDKLKAVMEKEYGFVAG